MVAIPRLRLSTVLWCHAHTGVQRDGIIARKIKASGHVPAMEATVKKALIATMVEAGFRDGAPLERGNKSSREWMADNWTIEQHRLLIEHIERRDEVAVDSQVDLYEGPYLTEAKMVSDAEASQEGLDELVRRIENDERSEAGEAACGASVGAW